MEASKVKLALISAQNAYDSAVAKLKTLSVNPPKRRDANVTITMQMLHKAQVRQAEKNLAERLTKLQEAKRNFKKVQVREQMIGSFGDLRNGNKSAPKPGEY